MPLVGRDSLPWDELHHEPDAIWLGPHGSGSQSHQVNASAEGARSEVGSGADSRPENESRQVDINLQGRTSEDGLLPEHGRLTRLRHRPSFPQYLRGRSRKLQASLSLHSLMTSNSSWYYLTMAIFSISITFAAFLLLLVAGAPAPSPAADASTPASGYWLGSIARKGTVAYGTSGYQVFRNVKDFGAKGDGSTDDTVAINAAITAGSRCGQGCDSTTITPAIVYFPSGTYMVSKPLIQYYYTQFIGDATRLPTLKATAGFQGIAVIDADPYADGGVNWFTNQNNFFRQVRNFVIDLTAMPASAGAGIHWQVAQATSLHNIVFNMRTDGGTANAQLGIFMDNGSGGFMTDLTFNGGKYGAFFGSQQFTTRNMTFHGCQTAVFMNWNWAWTLSGLTIDNCGVGVDMANGGTTSQTVGSVLLVDSTISNTPIGISTAYSTTEGSTNGSLIIDNVNFSPNVPVAVSNPATKATVLAGNTKVASWVQGRNYNGANSGSVVQGPQTAIAKPASLLNSAGNVFTRSKPQYEKEPLSAFKSAKAAGAKGDGVTDDTAAIQALFNSVTASDIVYFDHGAYVVTNTIKVPKNIRITGEIWPLIMAGGSSTFKDQNNPKPVFQVGQPGDVGTVEMSDIIFETLGPQPGAILMEWNVKGTSQGSTALWDVHFRIGGSAGTQLQSNTCSKNPTVTAPANEACIGAYMLLHITSKASAYLENTWFWVSDHELDLADHNQINIYNGRGVLITSEEGPVWLYGTSSEHNVLYNYQISNASNVYMALIQTETPYFQSNPDATTPFKVQAAYSDPTFAGTSSVNKAWGLRIVNSDDVFVYGAGLYSFFDNYSQTCLTTESCQDNMVSVEHSAGIHMYGLSTKSAVNMVTVNGKSAALDKDNRNNFCAAISHFEVAASSTPT
ncbi:1,3-beta glucanase [Marssonina coronariae]|uniref:1,3-beta glucanase n=1 Tax=Diplocarpon coronariae TaxID=2795749 RepID=A0A218Z824_9HELO|nr:1,3-beta glucanase [Marssonina coronariae]